ncbi:MAG TPA: hypothetical protein VKY19_20110 [Ktedonosporobacter sp.]|nr:hypothetical protein [Ktedonosporobacter sp.]
MLTLTDTVLLTGDIFGVHIVVTLSMVIYLAIAAVIGLIAETVVGWRLPFGIVGAILAALLGIWLLTNVVQVTIPGDFTIAGQPIPLIKALLGAFVVVIIWHLITYPTWRHRRRYYRGYHEGYRRYYRE